MTGRAQNGELAHYVAPLTIAQAYVDLGGNDRTLDWLNKAYQERSNGLHAVAPCLDALRSDPLPRFIAPLESSRRFGQQRCRPELTLVGELRRWLP